MARGYESADELGLGLDPSLPAEKRVDADNWMEPPFNRWSFQRVQQLTRTARIPRADAFSPLHEKIRGIESLSYCDPSGSESSIGAMLQRTWTDGFLVLHRGHVVSELYFNGMTPSTLHLIMSCSKSVTSTVLGIAIEEGLLDLSLKLTDYLPELGGTALAGATLQHALDMQVGVDFDEDYDNPDADVYALEVATGWRPVPPDYSGPTDMLSYVLSLRSGSGRHGHVFHYQSVLTDVVGLALERATGRSFESLIRSKLWDPMGCEQDLVSIIDSAGNFVFEGGFNCCLRDFARFGSLICQSGTLNGHQIVPKSWIDECRMASPHLLDAFAQGEYGQALPGFAYHNKWWLPDPARGVLAALGVHGQMLYVDPENDFVVAKLSTQPDPADVDMALDQIAAFKAILEWLG